MELEPGQGFEELGEAEGDAPVVEATEAWAPDDDSLFRPPGSDAEAEPVRWADYASGMVSKEDLTRMRHEDKADLEQQIEAQRQQLQTSYQAAYQQALAQQQQQQQQGATPQQQQQSDIMALLEQADQQHGGLVTTAIVRELAQRFNGALSSRDQEIAKMYEAMKLVYGNQQQGANQVSQLVQDNQGAKLNSKMNEIFATHGIPDDSQDIASKVIRDIFDAHEPGTIDLDRDLPGMFEERWLSLKKAFHQISKADMERGKAAPGKGGQATPSLPLSNQGLNERELAEQAWQAIQTPPAT